MVSLALTSDGLQAVSYAASNTLKLWDLDGQVELTSLDLPWDVDREGRYRLEKPVSVVAMIPNDGRVVVASGGSVFDRDTARPVPVNGVIRVWDIQQRNPVAVFKGDTGFNACVVTGDGQTIVAADEFSRLHLPRMEEREPKSRRSIEKEASPAAPLPPPLKTDDAQTRQNNVKPWHSQGHAARISALAVTTDGRKILTGADDCNICVWDLLKGECLHTLSGHAHPLIAVAVTQDGQRAISASDDDRVRIWDLETGGLQRDAKKRQTRPVCSHSCRSHASTVGAG